MEAVKWYWNLLHYYLYIWHTNARRTIISPFLWFYNIPEVKSFYAKRGIKDISKFSYRKSDSNPKTGMDITSADSSIFSLLLIIEFIAFNILQYLISKNLYKQIFNSTLYIIMLILVSGAVLINYAILF